MQVFFSTNISTKDSVKVWQPGSIVIMAIPTLMRSMLLIILIVIPRMYFPLNPNTNRKSTHPTTCYPVFAKPLLR